MEEPKQLQNKPLKRGKTLLLFDIDGTLVEPKLEMEDAMYEFLLDISKNPLITMSCVTCSNLKNVKRELHKSLPLFKIFYTENGLVTYDNQFNLIRRKSMKEDYLGEEKFNELTKFLLDYVDKLDHPYKVGNYLDIRDAVINAGPVGNPVTLEQRAAFKKFDEEKHLVETMRKTCEETFAEKFGLRFTKGGIKSFDIFPIGWDKTYCLQFIEVEGEKYENIVFFGDNTYPGGADYDIAINEKITKGINVKNPEDTIKKVKEIIKEIEEVNK